MVLAAEKNNADHAASSALYNEGARYFFTWQILD